MTLTSGVISIDLLYPLTVSVSEDTFLFISSFFLSFEIATSGRLPNLSEMRIKHLNSPQLSRFKHCLNSQLADPESEMHVG